MNERYGEATKHRNAFLPPTNVNSPRNEVHPKRQPNSHKANPQHLSTASAFCESGTPVREQVRDVRSELPNRRAKSNLSPSRRNPADSIENYADVPLSLEFEIDGSLSDLLSIEKDKLKISSKQTPQPELDVTFIQQTSNNEPNETTVALPVDQISQLLDIISAKANHIHVEVDDNDTPEDGLDEHQKDNLQQYWNLTESEEEYLEDLIDKGIVPPKQQQIYTTPQHVYNDLKTKLPCLQGKCGTSESEEGKLGTPCLCQHCGMVGILVESQKRPAIPHTPNPKFMVPNPNHQQRSSVPRKMADLRTKSKSETNVTLLKDLAAKIENLEERLSEHEEKTVRKDYFKFVIHKLLTQYANKINELRNTGISVQKPSINIATQYSGRVCQTYGAHSVNPKMQQERDQHKHNQTSSLSQKQGTVNRKSSTEDCTMGRMRRRQKSKGLKHESATPRNHFTTDIQSVYPASNPQKDIGIDNSSDHRRKNLSDVCSTQMYDRQESPRIVQTTHCDLCPQSPQQPQNNAKNKRDLTMIPEMPTDAMSKLGINATVSYLNPTQQTWHNKSEQEFSGINRPIYMQRGKHSAFSTATTGPSTTTTVTTTPTVYTTDKEANNTAESKHHSVEEKIRYLHYLARRKGVSENELWSNILNQAKRHIRSNNDMISIELPRSSKRPDMSELELTLTMLNEIARKSRKAEKTSSSCSIDMQNDSSNEYIDSLTRE